MFPSSGYVFVADRKLLVPQGQVRSLGSYLELTPTLLPPERVATCGNRISMACGGCGVDFPDSNGYLVHGSGLEWPLFHIALECDACLKPLLEDHRPLSVAIALDSVEDVFTLALQDAKEWVSEKDLVEHLAKCLYNLVTEDMMANFKRIAGHSEDNGETRALLSSIQTIIREQKEHWARKLACPMKPAKS